MYIGLLKVKAALVFNTSHMPPDREWHRFGDPLETTWCRCTIGLRGVDTIQRTTFSMVITSTP